MGSLAKNLFVATVMLSLAADAQDGRRVMNVAELVLRTRVATAPMPVYPPESAKEPMTGVVVAEVVFAADGRFEMVDIVESPDEHMAAAVRAAVAGWVLTPGTPSPRGDPAPALRGKLTFYFQLRDGNGVVLDPDQMPGGPPRPRPEPKPSSPPAGPPPAAPSTSSGDGAVKTISVEEFKKQSLDAVVVDVGDRAAFKRGHWPGAVNIPADEMGMRGGIELPRDKTIVIDCTQEQKFRCDVAAQQLAGQKFPNVLVLVRQ